MGESVERLGSKGGVVTGRRMEGTVTRWERKNLTKEAVINKKLTKEAVINKNPNKGS